MPVGVCGTVPVGGGGAVLVGGGGAVPVGGGGAVPVGGGEHVTVTLILTSLHCTRPVIHTYVCCIYAYTTHVRMYVGGHMHWMYALLCYGCMLRRSGGAQSVHTTW